MPKARSGYRMGHQTVSDHMFVDGLEDAYDKGRLMGSFAEECATSFAFTREAQDAFALTSLSRALAANEDGTFAWEIAPVTVSGRKGDTVVDRDKQPAASPTNSTLKPRSEGRRHGDHRQFGRFPTVRQPSYDAPIDGRARGLKPLAVIIGHATRRARLFTTAPVGAIHQLYEKTGWTTRHRPVRINRRSPSSRWRR
jgi:acetyl-CoA C-acetyltransferase